MALPSRRAGALASVVALALFVTACARPQPAARPPGATTASPAAVASPTTAAAFPLTLTDDEGVAVTLDAPPSRIVTFAPSNTEIVFALGVGDRVVGVSGPFDDYPPEAQEVEHVGGSGEFGVDPNLETVVALEPDLFLAIGGGDQWKAQLRGLGIPVFTVNATDLKDLLQDVRTIGRLTGVPDRAAELAGSMQEEADRIEAAVGAGDPVRCFFEAYYPPLTGVGPRTFIFDLLERAGCDPVTEDAASDYPEWSVDQLVEDGPEVYLVASESGVSPEAVARRPGFGAILAVREGRVHLIDSDLVSRPGPRVVQGLAALADILHPGAA